MNTTTTRRHWRTVVACLCLASLSSWGQENKTVIGPSNKALHAGAEALLADDAEKGVRLTHDGLEFTSSKRDRVAGLSNLCAGYVMLGEPEKALPYCDQALELDDNNWRALSNRALVYVKLGRYAEADPDLQKAEEIAPQARTVKVVRSMLLDATNPVAPLVIIDDRRQSAEDDEQ